MPYISKVVQEFEIQLYKPILSSKIQVICLILISTMNLENHIEGFFQTC